MELIASVRQAFCKGVRKISRLTTILVILLLLALATLLLLYGMGMDFSNPSR